MTRSPCLYKDLRIQVLEFFSKESPLIEHAGADADSVTAHSDSPRVSPMGQFRIDKFLLPTSVGERSQRASLSTVGARNCAADRLASARPQERPATELTTPWRRGVQSNALHSQPGAAAFSGDRKNEQRYTASASGPRNGRSTDRTERPRRALVLRDGRRDSSRKPSGCAIPKTTGAQA